jgi:predicted porin
MKKPLIAAIATLAVTAGAQAESKFYGKMNVTVGYDDVSETFNLTDNASRLGVKGSNDLGSSKVVYQAEFSKAVDGSNVLGTRDTYLGLSYGDMGTIKMGIMDTPLKKSQGKFDLFNDVVDIKNVLVGENRVANSINYTSAKMGALQASVSVILTDDTNADNGGANNGDGVSASLTYKQGGLYAAVAVDDNVTPKTTGTGKDVQTIRATAIYSMGDIRLGALINNVDKTDTADAELGFALNASMKMGKNTVKAQYESADQKALGATSLSLGLDHKLAKGTKAFAVMNMFDTGAVNTDMTSFALGLEHKF